MAKKGEVKPSWYVVDAADKVLGKLATKIATILMGKHKPTYTPHVDVGDFVIVINAEKVAVTGNKRSSKTYFHYSGYPGGGKSITLEEMLKKKPERVIQNAVKRMLPKSRLGARMFKKLRVYAGPDHPHSAQKLEVLTL